MTPEEANAFYCAQVTRIVDSGKAIRPEDRIEILRRILEPINLQLREAERVATKFKNLLMARRAMEPKHSREDHECPECEAIAGLVNQPIEKRKCASTYTHSSLGKLTCEKDGEHLHRIGDVEHRNGETKWMSI